MNRCRSKLVAALELLPDRVRAAIEAVPEGDKLHIQEIRLRRCRKLSVTVSGREYFVEKNGTLHSDSKTSVDVNDEDIDYTFRTALRNSVHSFEKEISQGFVTCAGGNRVGFCGKAVNAGVLDDRLTTVKDISSVNIRIAREVIGCSKELCEQLFKDGLCSVIVYGPPSSGKTTVLRDICLTLSARCRISLIDERGEIAAVSDGVPQNDVGDRTDVFTGYSKQEAMITAVRVMSPQVLICDEIGSKNEYQALEYAVDSGVKLIVSAHASDTDELMRRPAIGRLIKEEAFDSAVCLGTGKLCGKAVSYHSLKK